MSHTHPNVTFHFSHYCRFLTTMFDVRVDWYIVHARASDHVWQIRGNLFRGKSDCQRKKKKALSSVKLTYDEKPSSSSDCEIVKV